MNLKKNKQVKVITWVNSQLFSDQGWEVFTEEDQFDDAIYFLVKDPETNNEIKFKIEKV
jgi:hypothetical protein